MSYHRAHIPTHDPIVTQSRANMYFYAVCPCGWQSRSLADEKAADLMITHHLEIAAELAEWL